MPIYFIAHEKFWHMAARFERRSLSIEILQSEYLSTKLVGHGQILIYIKCIWISFQYLFWSPNYYFAQNQGHLYTKRWGYCSWCSCQLTVYEGNRIMINIFWCLTLSRTVLAKFFALWIPNIDKNWGPPRCGKLFHRPIS